MHISLPDISQSRIGLIYVYYERKNQSKNQTNLSFFLKYGLGNYRWLNLNIEYLFVINGYLCEVDIPSKPNIHILKEHNCSDYEGWLNGIRYYEKKFIKPIWEIFDYLCLINCGCFGPVYEDNINDHWLIPFYNKMVKYNAVISTPCISFFNNEHPGGVGPRVVPIFSLLRCTKDIIRLLTTIDVSHECPSYIHFSKQNHYFNTVLGFKKDKDDAVRTGEYGLSRILLNFGYRLSCLLYDFDCNDPNFWNITLGEPDRYNSFNGTNIPLSTIFIKNIWRTEYGYVSFPVLYDECIKFMFDKLKMKPPLDPILNLHSDNLLKYNYDTLNVVSSRPSQHIYIGWNSKEEYYRIHGRSEEDIIFVKSQQKQQNVVIYAHYDSDNIIKDYVLQNINGLIYVGYDIIFYTASEIINNIDECILPFTINYIKNEGPGTDFLIWEIACKKLVTDKIYYHNILLLNDSIILPINGLNNFKNTIDKMRATSDFWGHWESDEIEWHIISCQIEFKYKMINDIVHFLGNRLGLLKKTEMQHRFSFAVQNIEVKLAKYLCDIGYKHNTVIKKNILDNNVACPVFHPTNLYKWINNPDTFAIKWKYSISYIIPETVSKELNYLTRFLYQGKYGFISNAEKCGGFPKSYYDA